MEYEEGKWPNDHSPVEYDPGLPVYPNNFNTTSTLWSNAAAPTIERIRQVMREFMEKWKDRGPDVLVLTNEEYAELYRQLESKHPVPMGCDPFLSGLTIYGINIERYATRAEVRTRVTELASKGIKAGFLKDGE